MQGRHFIRTQKLREIKGHNSDAVTTHIQGNPDSLREDQGLYAGSQVTRPQELMGEAIEHLQGRQRAVYLLTMREGKSIAESAEILGIAKGTAQVHRDRAIKFLSDYCRLALDARDSNV